MHVHTSVCLYVPHLFSNQKVPHKQIIGNSYTRSETIKRRPNLISDFTTFLFWSYAPDYFSWKMWEEIGASVSVCSSKFFSQIFEQLNWKNWGYNKPIRLLHVWINSTNTVIIVTYSDGVIINRFIASRLFPIIDYGNFPDSLSLLWHDISNAKHSYRY